jgi:hypothetical protein
MCLFVLVIGSIDSCQLDGYLELRLSQYPSLIVDSVMNCTHFSIETHTFHSYN